VAFVAFAILSPDSFRPTTTANGLGLNSFVDNAASRVPNAWKRDPTTGQPRVCKLIEQTLGVATRIILLGGSSTTSTSKTSPYVVEAESNRAALGGSLSKLSIAIDNSRSPLGLLAVEHLEVEGSNLKLGWRPLIATAGVPLALFVRPIRQSVWTLSIYYYLWSVARTLAQRGVASSKDASVTSTARNIDQRMQAVEVYADRWKRRILGGSPSDVRFEMVLSNDNLANSTLLRQASKFLLRFLMKNSILQTAATVGDAVSDSQQQQQQQQQASNQWRRNQNLLKGSSPLEKIGQRQPPPSNGNNSARDNTPRNKLSSLLSATAFELKEAPTFMAEDGKNHLQFVSKAILPDNQGRLDFVLRTTLEAGRGNRDSGVLRFVQPECRFDVTEATSSLLLPKVVSGLLPKVLWLPIGSGVAIGGGAGDATGGSGGGLSIRNLRIIPGGECMIAGNLSFLKVPPPANGSGGLVRRR
jgi:hypothetical protein